MSHPARFQKPVESLTMTRSDARMMIGAAATWLGAFVFIFIQ